MPIKKVSGGFKVKYPGKKARVVRNKQNARRVQAKQKKGY